MGAVLGAACIGGFVFGLLAVHAAVGHNPAGAYIDNETGAVDYLALSEIFFSWFVLISAVVGLALTVVVWAVRGIFAMMIPGRGRGGRERGR